MDRYRADVPVQIRGRRARRDTARLTKECDRRPSCQFGVAAGTSADEEWTDEHADARAGELIVDRRAGVGVGVDAAALRTDEGAAACTGGAVLGGVDLREHEGPALVLSGVHGDPVGRLGRRRRSRQAEPIFIVAASSSGSFRMG